MGGKEGIRSGCRISLQRVPLELGKGTIVYSEENLLCLRNFSVTAGCVRLLEGIDINLEMGQWLALTGPSGCGKSTLLRALAGLIDPSNGTIRFRGQEPHEIGWPLYRRQVVLVEQKPALLDASVLENLQRPFRYRIAGKPFSIDRARELLTKVGLKEERLHQNARSLSVGQQQRVCLVRALLVEPVVLLLDEPTSALDQKAILKVQTLLKEEAHRHAFSLLMVLHDIAQAKAWCQHFLDLKTYMIPDDPSSAGKTLRGPLIHG